MKILASLGDFADEGAGRIVEIDLATRGAREVLRWTPPERLRVRGKGFTGMAWSGTSGESPLLVCSHSSVVRVDARTWTVTGVLHDASMNDLHHVAVHDGRILVANTGADRIDTFDLDGRFLGGWDLAPAWVGAARHAGTNPTRDSWKAALAPGWSGASPALVHEPVEGGYYDNTGSEVPFHTRKVRDFVHPNHVAVVEGRVFVTRFQDRAVQDLGDWSLVIPETPGFPHDGVVDGDRFWITCTNGDVVAYAVERGRVTERIVERANVFEQTGHTGWCRGLLVTPALLVVGLTAIEKMPRYRWCDRPFDKTETAVVAIDRKRGDLVAHVPLAEFGARPKLFDLEAER